MKLKDLSALNEAKSVIDLRHEPSTRSFFPEKTDPKFVKPSDGFHFAVSSDNSHIIIYSSSNEFFSAGEKYGFRKNKYGKDEVAYPSDEMRKIVDGSWNQFSGFVDLVAKTITVTKENYSEGTRSKMRMRTADDIKTVARVFKDLRKYGVTDAFVIKGGGAGFSKTVGEQLKLKDPRDVIFNKNTAPVFYHGTSISRAEKIMKTGLNPGHTGEAYVDLIPQYSDYNVYLTTMLDTAKFYGKRQAEKDGDSQYVVLEIRSVDPAKIVADDMVLGYKRWAIHRGEIEGDPKTLLSKAGHNHSAIKNTLTTSGQVGYRGRIPPALIKIAKTFKR